MFKDNPNGQTQYEPTPQEPLGDSEGTITPVVVGLEPVFEYLDTNWLYSVLRYADKNPDYFPDVAEGKYALDASSADDVAKLYSAATVERLVQERDHWREANRTSLAAGDILKEQLAASQAREQQLREALVWVDNCPRNFERVKPALSLPQDEKGTK